MTIPAHTITIKHETDDCAREKECTCAPSWTTQHHREENCTVFGPCELEATHDYLGFSKNPDDENSGAEGAPWEGGTDHTFHGVDHEWIDGEWMVQKPGCGLRWAELDIDIPPVDGVFPVAVEYDGEWWEATIGPVATGGAS